ncbi:MAG: ice-binding family protein [Thermoanaerobaculia bacterium]
MRKQTGIAVLLGITALLFSSFPALAQDAPDLGTAGQFGVLGGSGVTGSPDPGTIVVGDVGSYPTASVTGFPPSSAPGFEVHLAADAIVQQARADTDAAYADLAGRPGAVLLAAELAGETIFPGIYSFSSSANIAANGLLTLSGDGIFIFQVGSTLTANALSNVIVIDGADPCNVYWQIGSSATLNGATFLGNVLASASISVDSNSDVSGKLLAGPEGAVTLAVGGNTVGGCVESVTPAPIPTLGFYGMATLLILLAGAGLFLVGRLTF